MHCGKKISTHTLTQIDRYSKVETGFCMFGHLYVCLVIFYVFGQLHVYFLCVCLSACVWSSLCACFCVFGHLYMCFSVCLVIFMCVWSSLCFSVCSVIFTCFSLCLVIFICVFQQSNFTLACMDDRCKQLSHDS